MNSPHLARTTRTPSAVSSNSGSPDLPTGWKQYASRARGLTFRYPATSTIARQANYLFVSFDSGIPCEDASDRSTQQLVLDLTPIHLYPYNDVKEYLEKTHKRAAPDAQVDVKALPGGYLAGRLYRPCCSGKDFFMFYIGKGNLSYTLTVIGKELLGLAEEIIASLRFR